MNSRRLFSVISLLIFIFPGLINPFALLNNHTQTSKIQQPNSIVVPPEFEVYTVASGLGGIGYPGGLQDIGIGTGSFAPFLYYIDSGQIYRVSPLGGTPELFTSVPNALKMQFGFGGDMFVTAYDGSVSRVLIDGTTSNFAQLSNASEGMAFDLSGDYREHLFLSEFVFGASGILSEADENGNVVNFVSQGNIGIETTGLEFCFSPRRLYAIDQIGTIYEVTTTGSVSYIGDIDLASNIEFGESLACGSATTSFGNYLYVAEQNNPEGRILRVSPEGDIEVFATGFQGFDTNGVTGLVFSPDGNTLYVTDDVGRSIYAIKAVATCSSNFWSGQYYGNRDLLGAPILNRCDQSIDFYWGNQGPGGGVSVDDFSVRWTKNIDIPADGWYKFRAFTDDGLRLFMDGNLVIDDWVPRSYDERDTIEFLTQGAHEIVMEYVEWSNEAMAYLNWYLCPNGNDDCDLLITPDYQTRYLDQAMPATCTIEPNQTIARWGCLLTSISMNFRNFGIVTSPAELNQWLSGTDPKNNKTPRGYRSTCNGDIIWDQIIKYAEEVHGINLEWHNTNNAIDVIRNKELPVIMSVARGGHFTLAVDVINYNGQLSLGINDPQHSWACQAIPATPNLPPRSELQCTIGPLEHASTLAEETLYRGASRPLKYLDYRSHPRTASLQLNILGSEAMLIDSLGRRLGYDPATGDTLQEIPNSFYYDSEIIPSGSSTTNILERLLYIPQDAGGNFVLRLFGINSQLLQSVSTDNPEIFIIGFDDEFDSTEYTLYPSTGVVEYQIEYDPGVEIDVTPITKVFLPVLTR